MFGVVTSQTLVLVPLLLSFLAAAAGQVAGSPQRDLEFIDTSFENASPVWYDFAADGTINVYLLYDHERSSPNRAAGHIHFALHARPGAKLTLEFKNLENVWNGQPSFIANELKTVVVSQDGRDWKAVLTQTLPERRIQFTIVMPGPQLYVARVEPYRLSDLDRLLASIRSNRLVEIRPIGKTAGGRELEIVRIGNPMAPYRVFLRARAHPRWTPENRPSIDTSKPATTGVATETVSC